MFKLTPNPTFWAKIAIPVPGEETPQEIEVEFRHKGKADLIAFMEEVKGRADADVVFDLVSAWKNVDAEYTRENLGQLIDHYHGAALAILSGYHLALAGGRVKN